MRFDWGDAGARRIAGGAHVVVIADELDGHGEHSAAERARAVVRALGAEQAVLSVTEASATDAAARILTLQESLGARAVVAIIGAGSLDDDGFRPCVEDLLTAGAVVDALADAGIDFASPEAAAACAAFVGLRNATAHLATATASASSGPEDTRAPDARAQRDAHPPIARVLREFSPRA